MTLTYTSSNCLLWHLIVENTRATKLYCTKELHPRRYASRGLCKIHYYRFKLIMAIKVYVLFVTRSRNTE